ncbi:hypothetical protein BC833DRAFT_586418 [Globomyces pollinis-pini]|nr:hypothetical protein BC833DRAFT_586418 [Globomyces pollinis-pini]
MPDHIANLITNPDINFVATRSNAVISQPVGNIEEPLIVKKSRGRPAGSKNKKSTTWDKSHFEYVDGRQCSRCHQGGHKSRTRSNC